MRLELAAALLCLMAGYVQVKASSLPHSGDYYRDLLNPGYVAASTGSVNTQDVNGDLIIDHQPYPLGKANYRPAHNPKDDPLSEENLIKLAHSRFEAPRTRTAVSTANANKSPQLIDNDYYNPSPKQEHDDLINPLYTNNPATSYQSSFDYYRR
ncbi:hypothetical protein IWQ60_004610 [Tieghemiomyces parasiticus]|uniref:Uncharacterized protein n=1 Tax=Tieghemiomyces parasiticus TaxID=78921 RepID=A0A9W8AFZ1_9FUNG|nr:hypothetical protein IWQ60_004610 [Tieghemiomyces parasiticus]